MRDVFDKNSAMRVRIARALACFSPPLGSAGTFADTRDMLRKQAPVIRPACLRKHLVVFDCVFITSAPFKIKDPAANSDRLNFLG
jgi:hypothetical protein